MSDYFLYDARNKKVYASFATRMEAEKAASDLNAFIYRNGIGATLGIPVSAVKITGPFYVQVKEV